METYNDNDTCAWCETETAAPGLCSDCEQLDKRAAAEDLAHEYMEATCDAYNAAHRAGADEATLAPLRAAHANARDEWRRVCAANGCKQSQAVAAVQDLFARIPLPTYAETVAADNKY